MKRMIRGVLSLSALAFAAGSAWAACSIKITSTYAVNESNALVTPTVGDSVYGLRVAFTVSGTPKASFPLRFRLFTKEAAFTVPAKAGTYTYYAYFTVPTDEDLKWQVDVDPSSVSGNTTPGSASKSVSIVQAVPTYAVEYTSYKKWLARQSFTVNWTTGTYLNSLEAYAGSPYPAMHQKVSSVTPQYAVLTTWGRYGLTYARSYNTKFSTTQTVVGCSSQIISYVIRTKQSLLNKAAYPTSSNITTAVKPYLLMDDGTSPSTVTGLSALVEKWAPKASRASDGPYVTARKLFKGTVAALSYTSSNPSTLAAVISSARGNDEGYSALFVNACRVAGIPARVVPGYINGTGSHTWSEIWLPSYGWIPQDAQYSDQAIPDGSASAWFGLLPDGSDRFATTTLRGWYVYAAKTGAPYSYSNSIGMTVQY